MKKLFLPYNCWVHAISDKCYEHVLNVWKIFEIGNMKQYDNLYWQDDILSLACMFETLRKESISSFELDPAHYLSTPG